MKVDRTLRRGSGLNLDETGFLRHHRGVPEGYTHPEANCLRSASSGLGQ